MEETKRIQRQKFYGNFRVDRKDFCDEIYFKPRTGKLRGIYEKAGLETGWKKSF